MFLRCWVWRGLQTQERNNKDIWLQRKVRPCAAAPGGLLGMGKSLAGSLFTEQMLRLTRSPVLVTGWARVGTNVNGTGAVKGHTEGAKHTSALSREPPKIHIPVTQVWYLCRYISTRISLYNYFHWICWSVIGSSFLTLAGVSEIGTGITSTELLLIHLVAENNMNSGN